MKMLGFIDFEYNNKKEEKGNEIIQIGAVVVDDNYYIIEQFSSLVKLKNNNIGKIISNMTGITQKDIDDADDFKTVSEKFVALFKKYGNITFYCWGNCDVPALKNTCKINNCYIILDVLNNIYNIQPDICRSILYNDRVVRKRISQRKMCDFYGISKRKEHDALNDALTLAAIYNEWLTRGDFIYPTGFQKNNIKTDIACRVVEEIMKSNEEENIYETDEEVAKSLIEFIDGEKELKKPLNIRVLDTCKKYFHKKTLLEDEIKVDTINNDSIDNYTITVTFKNSIATITISDGIVSSSIEMETSPRNRKKIRNILKKMKAISVE